MGRENCYRGLDEYAVWLIQRKAKQLGRRAGFVEADRQDLEQEMALDLCRRLPHFNPARAQRVTFIARVVEHRAVTILETQRGRDRHRSAGSVEDAQAAEESAGVGEAHCPPDLHDEELRNLRLDMNRVLAALPTDLRTLCERLATSTVSEAARAAGIARWRLYEDIQKLRGQFQRAGLAAYLQGKKKRPSCLRSAGRRLCREEPPSHGAPEGTR